MLSFARDIIFLSNMMSFVRYLGDPSATQLKTWQRFDFNNFSSKNGVLYHIYPLIQFIIHFIL